jgi:drug/metabolite transporter (DMT)-like permease
MTSRPSELPEPRTWRHLGAFAAMCLVWGSTFLVIRLGNDTAPPIWSAALRLAIAAVCLAAIAAVRRIPYPDRAALRGVVPFGVLNLGISLPCIYWGEVHVSSGTAGLFFASFPLFTAFLAAAWGVHALDPWKTAAAVGGLAGVALIFAGEFSLGAPPLRLAAAAAAVPLSSIATVLLKRAAPAPAVTTNAVACAIGAVLCSVGSLLAGETPLLPATLAEWWPILYLALAGNLIAFVCYAWLLTQWTATTVATSALITPVIAVSLGAAVRGEALAPLSIAGAILVLAGVGATILRAAGTGSSAARGRVQS